MKTIEVTISIPTEKDNAGKIVQALAQLFDEWGSECENWPSGDERTRADMLGFGGNVLTVEAGGHVEEVCL